MTKNILLTGATGFLGGYLVEELVKKEYHVTALVRKESRKEKLEQLSVRIIQADLVDKAEVLSACASLPKNTILIHCAAVLENVSYAEYYDTHVEAAKNLIEACKQQRIQRVIAISTTSTLLQKRNSYGETKNIADLLFLAAKFNLTILKPDFIYGKGGPGFTNNLKLVKDLPFIPMVGNGTYTKQPVHVNDVVKAILAVLENEKTVGKTYVVAGKPLSYNEIITILQEALHVKKPLLHVPQSLFYATAFLLKNKKNAPFTKGSLDGLVQNSNFDISPLKEELGVTPLAFREGVALSV